MTTWVVLATGPSMSQEVADYVRGRAKVIAVSDAWQLAPWAEVMVSTDAAWWNAHPEALEFAGEKYTAAPTWRAIPGVQHIAPDGILNTGSNSGLLGCHVAYKKGATKIVLCGFDMGGTHYFGPHPAGLVNTPPQRFCAFKKQFAAWKPPGIDVVNCTPGSALLCYRLSNLKDEV